MTDSDRKIVGYTADRKNHVAQSYIRRESVMGNNTVFVGLDVHLDSIYIAIAESGRDGEVRSMGSVANRPETIRKSFGKLQAKYKHIYACYEAGPCGYGLYWQLTGMNINCEVIAPSLIPRKSGDRVKTDKRDALMLARCHRAGELTAVWVPDENHEALRDLVRLREAVKKDQRSARHRLSKLLIKSGVHKPAGVTNWTQKHTQWLVTQKFEQPNLNYVFQDYLAEVSHQNDRLARVEKQIDVAIEECPDEIKEVVAALQMMRGVAKVTAVGVVAEVGQFSRFSKPDKLMSYAGMVPSEYTTGGPGKKRQGGITKTGNANLRRLITESAWNYRFNPSENLRMKKAQGALKPDMVPSIKEKAWRAQHRLCGRYKSLLNSGKSKAQTVTAVGRELLGFIWDIAVSVEKNYYTA
jgi:transposase